MDFLLFSSAEEGLEFPSFDGKDRVLNVNERNYKKALKKYDMMCLLYHEPLRSDKELQQQFHMREMVLEVRKHWAKEETEEFSGWFRLVCVVKYFYLLKNILQNLIRMVKICTLICLQGI